MDAASPNGGGHFASDPVSSPGVLLGRPTPEVKGSTGEGEEGEGKDVPAADRQYLKGRLCSERKKYVNRN